MRAVLRVGADTKRLGPTTEFKMTREDKVVPLSELKFTPLP